MCAERKALQQYSAGPEEFCLILIQAALDSVCNYRPRFELLSKQCLEYRAVRLDVLMPGYPSKRSAAVLE